MNFIIFFTGREGTSVLLRTLDKFRAISIVHCINDKVWEPFDKHSCGHMSLASLQECLELIYNSSQLDMRELNQIYTQTAKSPLNKIYVDCSYLETLISQCESRIQSNRDLIEWFQGAGVKAYPLLYEDFCDHKLSYFKRFFELIRVKVTEPEIETILTNETYFKKIHSPDISNFVINHKEVMDKFGDRYIVW